MDDAYFAWSYPAEKFGVARDVLTISFAPNWERMMNAMMSLTILLPTHFPDQDIYERVEKLRKTATAFGPQMLGDKIWAGALENTLRKRKRVTFERMAEEIVAIDDEIRRRRGSYNNFS